MSTGRAISSLFPIRRGRKGGWIPRGPLFALVFWALVLTLGLIGEELWTLSGGDPRGSGVLVTEVMDGDTIHVGRGRRHTSVRLIGVDAPETVHPEKPIQFYGPQASEFTKRSLQGKWVRLEFEPLDPVDRYGRMLAYVFLEEGTFFNQELVRQGYARVYTRSPFRYLDQFLVYQEEARQAGLGLWIQERTYERTKRPIPPSTAPSISVPPREPPSPATAGKIIGNVRSKIYHLPGQPYYDQISEKNRVYFDTEEKAIQAGYRRARN